MHVPKEFSNLREFFLELVALLVGAHYTGFAAFLSHCRVSLNAPIHGVVALVSVHERTRRSGISRSFWINGGISL